MNPSDAFKEFYKTDGIRYFDDLSHEGIMEFAFIHGWAACRASKGFDDFSHNDLKAVARYYSAINKKKK